MIVLYLKECLLHEQGGLCLKSHIKQIMTLKKINSGNMYYVSQCVSVFHERNLNLA